ncbi:helix-turn-helix domain-containing protein [Erythrobacter mangrovi]|uniref:Helix-turn-helix domain-containing protein n=1 Tax=Erythrobacter mangrovi TaxID=2739433 RepID=A0A7D3XB63_9SPHN|nr:helix-turn-helix domain-containing protein [Erythrobacter mangrovi]QKG71020.1 helix-turn-helix domain-containing protein [Erythrobacter mangrovi]
MSKSSLATVEYASNELRLRLVGPPPDLAPYLSGYYRTEVMPGALVEDWLPPEEANLRTGQAEEYVAAIGTDQLAVVPPAVISGPTDRVTHLRLGGGKFWGIGLTPAGWARFIGLPASDFANRFDDIARHPRLQSLRDMLDTLRGNGDDTDASVALINRTFRDLLDRRSPNEAAIHAVHHAIGTEGNVPVAQIACMAGMNARTFERFCGRHFGFPPARLLRRQRFLRSLGKYMLDPAMRWINSLDGHYHDQAHFIREFRSIMQMTPTEYAERSHPITGAAVQVISAAAGVAMQALHMPRVPPAP